MDTLQRLENLEVTVQGLVNKLSHIPPRQPQQVGSRVNFSALQAGKFSQLNINLPLFVHNPKTAGRAFYQKFRTRLNYYIHMSARDIRARAGKEFDTVFSFAFVRHPCARFLSAFYFATDTLRHTDVDPNEFCRLFQTSKLDWVPRMHINHAEHFLTQSFYVVDDDGKPIVTKLYRYEELAHALKDLEDHGVSEATSFQVRYGKSTDWATILDETSRKIIKDAYACDFDLYERVSS
jgi:hypothetical protein